MQDYISEFSQSIEKNTEHLKGELQAIRTGRASSTLIESIQVSTYGGTAKLRLLEIASLSQDGPQMITITPYDASTVQDIEKAILSSPIGITPKVQGTAIIVTFPELTQEQREKFVKLVGQTVEEHKSRIRHARDEVRKKIKAALDAKEITEDDKFRLEKEIDSKTQKANETFAELKQKKEDQIRAV